MNRAITLGPFAIGLEVLILAIAFAAAALAGWLAGRKQRLDVSAVLVAMLWAGLLAARAVFVAQWFEEYRHEPLGILDIRDGGFNAWAGIAAALAVAAWKAWRARPLRLPLAAAVASGAVVWGILAALPQPGGGPPLPATPLQTLDGKEVSLAELGAGVPTVVNLWATWCPPCRREMPVLAEAQQRERGVRFVFADQGEDAARVRRYLAQASLTGLENVLLDPTNRLGRELGSAGLPTTFFYDSAGRLVDTHVGALSAATLAAKLATAKSVPRGTARKPRSP